MGLRFFVDHCVTFDVVQRLRNAGHHAGWCPTGKRCSIAPWRRYRTCKRRSLAALQGLLGAGVVADGVGVGVFKAVAQHARTRPDGLNAIPLFPPTFTSHQVLVLTLSVPAPGPVSMPVPGYVTVAGSLAEDRFSSRRSSEAKKLLLEPEFGHVDHFMSPRHRRYVELPILSWLRDVLG